MKTIDELWKLLKNVELIQVRPIEMEAMYKHCFEFKDPLIIEIGSAHGASSIIFAEAAKELNGRVICIDSFPEYYYGQEKFGNYARQAFKKNVHKNYSGWVELLDMRSVEAIKHITTNKKVDILFIDGDHGYEAVKKDIQLYTPLVRSGGYVGFHDYFNVEFHVQKAVDKLLSDWGKPAQYWDLAIFKKP